MNDLNYYLGQNAILGITESIILLALTVGVCFLCYLKFKAKNKERQKRESSYRHRELNNANLHDRKHI